MDFGGWHGSGYCDYGGGCWPVSWWVRFSDPDRSLNRKNKRFKVFEVEPRSNRDDVIINLIIN